MKKKKLQDELAALKTKHGELLKQTETEGTDVVALLAQSDQIEADIKAKSAELAAVEQLEERTRRNAELAAQQEQQQPRQPAHAHDRSEDKPFATFGDQIRSVILAFKKPHEIDPRLHKMQELAATGSSEAVPSDGGFLVQSDFAADLLTKTYDSGLIVNRCRKQPITNPSNRLTINGVDETSRADGSRFGGIQAYWTDEAAAKTGSKPKFRQIVLSLKKLTGLHYLTDELMADVPALEAFSREAFAEEFAFKLDDAIFSGSGADRPLGILNSPALVSVAKESGQTAATFTFANAKRMYSRMWARSRPKAAWFINQDVEPEMMGMSVEVGTGGAPVFLPPGGVSASPYSTLFGRPVIPVEQASTLGTKGDVVLADMSQYLIADKGGIQSAVSMHVRFVNDETVIRFVYRVDGQPIWNSALTPYKGTNTTSPFVTLDTRA